jgi:hypothetical protein
VSPNEACRGNDVEANLHLGRWLHGRSCRGGRHREFSDAHAVGLAHPLVHVAVRLAVLSALIEAEDLAAIARLATGARQLPPVSRPQSSDGRCAAGGEIRQTRSPDVSKRRIVPLRSRQQILAGQLIPVGSAAGNRWPERHT